MRRVKLGTAFALFLVACLFVLPGVSLGHAFPDHSDPRVGSTVSVSPTTVRIWFDSEMEPAFSTITVQDANGRRVDKGDGRVDSADATLLEVSLPLLPPGSYRVIWNVVAVDTHRTMGDFLFTIK